MSNVVQTVLLLDTADADEKITNLQARVDKTVEEWGIKRQDIMRGLAIVNSAMAIVTTLGQKVIDENAKAMMRVLSSLMSVVTTTVSTMYAVAAGYAATGVLAGIAAALAGFASGLALGQSLAISIAQAQVENSLQEAYNRLTYTMPAETFRSMMGGGI